MRPFSPWVVITVSLLLATWPATAQDPVSTFEVTSVKPNTSGLNIGPGARGVGVQPGGRFTMTDGTVLVLIRSHDVPVFTALREQLGLKLEPERNAVPVVVVERIERPTPDSN